MKLNFKVVEATKINEAQSRLTFEGGSKGEEVVRFTINSLENLKVGDAFEASVGDAKFEVPQRDAKVAPAKKAEPAPAKKDAKKSK